MGDWLASMIELGLTRCVLLLLQVPPWSAVDGQVQARCGCDAHQLPGLCTQGGEWAHQGDAAQVSAGLIVLPLVGRLAHSCACECCTVVLLGMHARAWLRL